MSPELDSNKGLIHLWLCWRFTGIYPFANFKWVYNIYSILTNLAFSIISPFSSMMTIFFVDNIELLVNSLQLSPTLLIATLKHLTAYLNISKLESLRPVFRKLDQRALRSSEDTKHLRKIIKQCRLIALTILSSLTLSLMSFAVPGYLKRRLLLVAWYPFDWNDYYLPTYTFQFLSVAFQVLENWSSDAYPPVYINLLKGHIQVLSMRVSRIGKNPELTNEENYQELKACINDHKNIICFFDTIKPIISQTMFLQFFITAFVWCIAFINYFLFNRSSSQLISTLMYMSGVMFESLPVCYFGNELRMETDAFTTALYSCNWIDQSAKFRKTLIIFMQRSQKTHVMVAGGLVTISLQTFISIIRFSFSVFTVLNNLR